MAAEKKMDPFRQDAQALLSDIDRAMLGLAQLRAQAGVYDYIPAARLTTRLTAIILSPTLLPIATIPQTPAVRLALGDLLSGMTAMGAVSDHE